MLTSQELADWETRRRMLKEHAVELRAKAGKLLEDADRIDAAADWQATWVIPVAERQL